MKTIAKRIVIACVVIVTALLGAAAIGFHVAAGLLKDRVVQALGTDSEVGDIVLGWSEIQVLHVRIPAPKGWPATDALRAERIVIVPDMLGLLSSKVLVHRITVDDAYLSVLRSRDGRLRLLPGQLESQHAPAQNAAASEFHDAIDLLSGALMASAQAADGGQTSMPTVIDTVELHGATVDFFDATIAQPPHKIVLDKLQAKVTHLSLPQSVGRTGLHLDSVVKGVQHDGAMSIDGWIELANQNSELTTKLRGVDLIALQPYLIKASETGVRSGTLDLDLHSTVQDNRLQAPGKVVLTNLELNDGHGLIEAFMGMPRQAMIDSLKNAKGQIIAPFTLKGNLKDPHFSLNESLLKQVGTSLAETMGVHIEGLAHGAGSVGQGVQSTIKKLLGK